METGIGAFGIELSCTYVRTFEHKLTIPFWLACAVKDVEEFDVTLTGIETVPFAPTIAVARAIPEQEVLLKTEMSDPGAPLTSKVGLVDSLLGLTGETLSIVGVVGVIELCV